MAHKIHLDRMASKVKPKPVSDPLFKGRKIYCEEFPELRLYLKAEGATLGKKVSKHFHMVIASTRKEKAVCDAARGFNKEGASIEVLSEKKFFETYPPDVDRASEFFKAGHMLAAIFLWSRFEQEAITGRIAGLESATQIVDLHFMDARFEHCKLVFNELDTVRMESCKFKATSASLFQVNEVVDCDLRTVAKPSRKTTILRVVNSNISGLKIFGLKEVKNCKCRNIEALWSREIQISESDCTAASIGIGIYKVDAEKSLFDRCRRLAEESKPQGPATIYKRLPNPASACKSTHGFFMQAVDCSFKRATLFAGMRMHGSTFTDCDMTGCDFRGADLKDVAFNNCILDKADFTAAHFNGVTFDQCSSVGMNVKHAVFRGSGVEDLGLQGLKNADSTSAFNSQALELWSEVAENAMEITGQFKLKTSEGICGVRMTMEFDRVAFVLSVHYTFSTKHGPILLRGTDSGRVLMCLREIYPDGTTLDIDSVQVKSKKAKFKGAALKRLLIDALLDVLEPITK